MRHPVGTPLTRRELIGVMGIGALTAVSGCGPRRSPVNAATGSLHYESLVDVARMIERGDLSPVTLTQQILTRVEALDGELNSYITVTAEAALQSARAAEQEIAAGNYRGPLHGVPIAVKDLCYTRGERTTGGSRVFSDFRPEYDATVVARLRAAGAVLIGKLSLTEGAWIGYHPDFEIPQNPWDAGLWAGVSSSGSGVATAAGLCFGSIGTDTGGSIRFPAVANGIVGLKPTYGRVSRYGVLAFAETLDHVGPMTRSVADAAVMLEAIAGSDPNDPTTLNAPVPRMLEELAKGAQGLRVGIDREYATDGVDPLLSAAIQSTLDTLEDQGATIVEADLPPFSQALSNDWTTIAAHEAASAHSATFPSRSDEYGEAFRELLEIGGSIPTEAYAQAMQRRSDYNERLRETLGKVDVVVIPPGGKPLPFPQDVQHRSTTELMAAFAAAAEDPSLRGATFFTYPADFAGVPTLSLPAGATPDGLPLGIQLMGSALSESLLCRVGHAFETATSWHTLVPPV